jgi:transcriptional regulator with XRE-family HTH domain
VSRTRNKEVHPVVSVSQPATGVVDVRELGALLRARRQAGGLTLRELQAQLGNALTASALSRIENGATPDPRNVPALAEWLNIPISQIAWPGQATATNRGSSTPDVVEVHLRADKKLDPVAAEVLARTFRVLYDDIVDGKIPLTREPKK